MSEDAHSGRKTASLRFWRNDRLRDWVDDRSRLRLSLYILLIVSIGVLLILWATDGNVTQADIKQDIEKGAIDLVIVGVATAVLGSLLGRLEAEREQNRRDFETRVALLREITLAYNEVKHARREMRGMGTDRSQLDAEQQNRLHAQMVALSRAQLTIEFAMRQVRVSGKAFRGRGDKNVYVTIEGHLSAMEDYVNRIVDEWEDGATEMARLKAFLGGPNAPGGLRIGWPDPPGPKLKKDFTGNGPSDQLRLIEIEIAESFPDAPATPAAAEDREERESPQP